MNQVCGLETTSRRWSADAVVVGGGGELANQLLCARLIAGAALLRRESRGAHYRSDYPESHAELRRRQRYDLETLEERVDLTLGLTLDPDRRRGVARLAAASA